MKTVTRTALANVKQNKGRNILCGIAIGLTTFLIFVILTISFGMLNIRDAAVNAYYPTFHAMFRQVTPEGIQTLKAYDDIESFGLREDFGELPAEDATVLMIALDDETVRLNKLELEEGNFPKNEKDVVVSQGMLDAMGLQAKLGDEITLPYQLYEDNDMGYEQSDTFRVCGIAKTVKDESKAQVYSAFFSMEYMEEKIPANQRVYRVMLRLKGASSMTTEKIEARCLELGKDIGMDERNVVSNTNYLAANYKDPSTYPITFGIVAIVVIAGILTIYSIYYVSMIPKVQEYGKLKAMGATKKQVRQIVFREGMLVSAAAIPLGLLISSLVSKAIILGMFRFVNNDSAYAKLAESVVKSGNVSILQPWIYLLTIVVTILTIVCSLFRPMQKAAKISPVEAMRYQEDTRSRKKVRKGYQELNLFRMMKANLLRNKKRTLITILTLSATGILFMVVATVLSCENPEVSAKRAIEADYHISIDSVQGDKMHPEREWTQIQQDNPMNDDFVRTVQEVDGVESVTAKSFAYADIEGYTTDDGDFRGYITGLDESYETALRKNVEKGDFTWKEFEEGNKILLKDGFYTYYFPELKPGMILHMTLYLGEKKVERDFELAAILDSSDSLASTEYILPKSVLEGMTDNNLTYSCDIEVTEDKKDEAYPALQALADNTGLMETDTYENQLKLYEQQKSLLGMAAYLFLVILGGIGIMNLMNTMINSIYTRKRELGMMQAIGMSDRQLIRMLQMEGLFYTVGVLILSLGIGSLAGYGVFLYAKAEHMFDIHYYQYPWMQSVILIVVVTVLQLCLTYGVTRSFRKQSLIDRVRYSE